MLSQVLRFLLLDENNIADLNRAVTISADGGVPPRSITVPGPTTSPNDVEVEFPLDVSTLKAIYIVSDKDVTMKVNAKDDASPRTLLANCPLVWFYGSGIDNPFGTDLTKLFFLNAASVNATVEIRGLVDATP